MPPMVIVEFAEYLPPVMTSEKAPAASRCSSQRSASGRLPESPPEPPPLVAALHVTVTCTPCSLPSGQGVGVPSGSAARLRLLAFGPAPASKKGLPAVAPPKVHI